LPLHRRARGGEAAGGTVGKSARGTVRAGGPATGTA